MSPVRIVARVVGLVALTLPALAGVAHADPAVAVIGPGPSDNVDGVKCVQSALGVRPTGTFGNVTYAAVKAFQSAHGLSVDGAVGPRTGDALVPQAPSGCAAHLPTTEATSTAQTPGNGQDSVATPQLAPDHSYAALGDSYASGEGAPPFDPTTDTNSNMCHRSKNSGATILSRLLADPSRNQPLSFRDQACSGATVKSIQLGQYGQGSQLTVLNDSTQLVSVSAGGNDVGFVDVVSGCIKATAERDVVPLIPSCRSSMRGDVQKKLNALLATSGDHSVTALYGAIKQKAPDARLLVVGYPHLFVGNSSCYQVSGADQKWINGLVDQGDDILSNAATQEGALFVDLRPAFAGHETCASDNWINGIRFSAGAGAPNEYISNESLHPNAAGQQAIANALQSVLG